MASVVISYYTLESLLNYFHEFRIYTLTFGVYYVIGKYYVYVFKVKILLLNDIIHNEKNFAITNFNIEKLRGDMTFCP